MTLTATTRLILLPRDPTCRVPCLRLDAHGQVLSRRWLEPDPAAPDPAVRTVVAVPGEAVRTLWLELPACTPVQALAATRILLREHLADDVDGLHIALAPARDGPRLLAATSHARMQAWHQRCQALGVVPDAMVPDHLLVDPAGDDGVQVLVHDGAWLVRGPQLAFAAEPALARAILGERGFTRVDDPAAVEALLAAGAAAPDPARLDLLQHAHARARGAAASGRRRRLAILAGLCLLSPLLLEGVPALRHAWGAQRMEQRAETLAAATMTDAAPGNAAAALHQRHRERAAPVALAVQAAALSDALERVPQARLDSLEYSPGAGLRAGLVHPGEAELEALRSGLAAAGFILSAQPGEPVDGGLRTPVMLEPAP